MKTSFKLSTTSIKKLSHLKRSLEVQTGPLRIILDRHLENIRSASLPRIASYMESRIYPSYRPKEVAEMKSSFRSRIDERKNGRSLAISFEHELLYAREEGKSVGGATRWVSDKGMISIDYERAALSKALAPLIEADKAKKRKNEEKQRVTAYKTLSKAERIRDTQLGNTRKSIAKQKYKEAPSALAFRSLNVEQAPFMVDIDFIVMEESRTKIGKLVDKFTEKFVEFLGVG